MALSVEVQTGSVKGFVVSALYAAAALALVMTVVRAIAAAADYAAPSSGIGSYVRWPFSVA